MILWWLQGHVGVLWGKWCRIHESTKYSNIHPHVNGFGCTDRSSYRRTRSIVDSSDHGKGHSEQEPKRCAKKMTLRLERQASGSRGECDHNFSKDERANRGKNSYLR